MPTAFPGEDDDDELPLAPQKKTVKMPKRRWMSVTDLVCEVGQALVKGERVDKGGVTYQNLQREATRLRMDNDGIIAEADTLREDREVLVTQEENIHERVSEVTGCTDDQRALAEVSERIQGIDAELAGLRHQQSYNIRDVGNLKRTMSLIEKRCEVAGLVDGVEANLRKAEEDNVAGFSQDDVEALNGLRDHLFNEFERASSKVMQYEETILEWSQRQREELSMVPWNEPPSAEALDGRMATISRIHQLRRKIAQLMRLVDIQLTNAGAIGELDRAQSKLWRANEIRRVVETGDKEQLAAMSDSLREETASLRNLIQFIEGDSETEESELSIISKLRSMSDALTPETGRLREQLVGNLLWKEQCKVRLKVLRGELVQNLRFRSVVRDALTTAR